VLFDERFDLVALVNDGVPVGLLDDMLDFIPLMTRNYGEAVALSTDAFVLGHRHEDAAVASGVLPALATEHELVVGRCPVRRRLIESSDLIVHGADQAFVARLPLEPLVHRQRGLLSGSGVTAPLPWVARPMEVPLLLIAKHPLVGQGGRANPLPMTRIWPFCDL
jgi:hypothetical protein